MKLFLACATLVVLGQSVAAQPEVIWEPVGDLPHDSRFPVSIGPRGDLWRAINEVKVINGEQIFFQGLYRLPPPYDATTSWEKMSEPAGSSYWVYAISRDTLLIHDTAGTYRSIDRGTTWTPIQHMADTEHMLEIPSGLPYAGRLIAVQRTKMAAVSDDRGLTWTPANASIQPATAERITVVTTGAHAGRLVSAGISGLMTSDDGGLTWQTTSEWAALEQATGCIATLRGQAPGGGDRLVTIMSDGRIADDSLRVITSDDGGETWQRGQTVLAGAFRSCEEVVDLGEGRAAAVMMRGPVWWTEDAGITWVQWAEWEDLLTPEDAVTADPRAFWALVGPDGRLHIGLFTGGGHEAVHDKRTSEVVAPTLVEKELPLVLGMSSIWVSPNPARQHIELALSGTGRQPVEIVVVDTQGREVARNELAAGSSWRLDVSGWAPGIYHARVAGDHQLEAVTFTVVR